VILGVGADDMCDYSDVFFSTRVIALTRVCVDLFGLTRVCFTSSYSLFCWLVWCHLFVSPPQGHLLMEPTCTGWSSVIKWIHGQHLPAEFFAA
jgi:hypothetical protein